MNAPLAPADRMTIARGEAIGAVLSTPTFDTVKGALRIANDTPYGLPAGVWSANIGTCMTVARRRTSVPSGSTGSWPDILSCHPAATSNPALSANSASVWGEDYTEENSVQFHHGSRAGWWMVHAGNEPEQSETA